MQTTYARQIKSILFALKKVDNLPPDVRLGLNDAASTIQAKITEELVETYHQKRMDKVNELAADLIPDSYD